MATLKKAIFQREVNKIIFSKDLETLAFQRADKIFQKIKTRALREFNTHKITKEIESGPFGENISGTIQGGNANSNLFSFIGFPAASDPTGVIREYLQFNINLTKKPESKKIKNGIQYIFDVEGPAMSELEALTPMPWEQGRSWIRGIERGISGIGFYLSGNYKVPEPSRSGGGIQVKNKVNQAIFIRSKYISEILANLRERLRKAE